MIIVDANVLAAYATGGSTEIGALIALDKVKRRVIPADRPVPEPRILELAVGSRSSAYDCEYVALAEMLYTKLIIADFALASKFPGIAVRLEEASQNTEWDW